MRLLFPATTLALACCAAAAAAHDLVLSEFSALDPAGVVDETGQPSPWIELHNRGNSTLDAGGLVLALDDAIWRIPAGTAVGPDEFLFVFADGEPDDGPLHAGFALGEFAATLRLLDVDGATELDTVAFPDQKLGVSTGRLHDDGEDWVSLLDPTPGGSNDPQSGSLRRFDAFDPFKHFLLHGAEGAVRPGGVLEFGISEAPPDSTLLWYFSPTTLTFGFPSGQSVLLVGLEFPAVSIPIGPDGTASFLLHVPNAPELQGLTIYTQGFVLQQYFKGSNALELVMGG